MLSKPFIATLPFQFVLADLPEVVCHFIHYFYLFQNDGRGAKSLSKSQQNVVKKQERKHDLLNEVTLQTELP